MKSFLTGLLSFLYFICNYCNGQATGFVYSAPLEIPAKSGLYDIAISPQMNERLQPGYRDLRIATGNGTWVPHIVHLRESGPTMHNLYRDLKVVSNVNHSDSSIIIVKCADSIDNLQYEISNTQVERFCSLAGSYDSLHWYIIKDSVLIQPAASVVKGKSNFILHFPVNDYRFYKLRILNKGLEPYNFISTSYSGYAPNELKRRLLKNPIPAIIPAHINTLSRYSIIHTGPFHTSSLQLFVSSPRYFSRTGRVFSTAGQKGSSRRLISSFQMTNNSPLQFDIPVVKDSLLLLEIENADNPAILFDSIVTFAQPYIITAYLEKGKSYHLLMGNPGAAAPSYDFEQTDINLQKTEGELKVGDINPNQDLTGGARQNWQPGKLTVWVVISLAAIILAYFSFQLVKEISKRKAENNTV